MKKRMGVVRVSNSVGTRKRVASFSLSKNQNGTEDVVLLLRGGARSWGKDSFLPPT